MYRGGRPNWWAKWQNWLSATVFALGVVPNHAVTLEVVGRKSGKTISFPLVMALVDGERYLVSMLGADANWVRNLEATGRATLHHGKREEVVLGEIEPALAPDPQDRKACARRGLPISGCAAGQFRWRRTPCSVSLPRSGAESSGERPPCEIGLVDGCARRSARRCFARRHPVLRPSSPVVRFAAAAPLSRTIARKMRQAQVNARLLDARRVVAAASCSATSDSQSPMRLTPATGRPTSVVFKTNTRLQRQVRRIR
jgi:hypothetical protein